VENGKLPLFDLRLATEDLRYPVTHRPQLILACQHGFRDCQALVAIQRPACRSTRMDKPTHPSMPSSAGITSSRTWVTPAPTDSKRV